MLSKSDHSSQGALRIISIVLTLAVIGLGVGPSELHAQDKVPPELLAGFKRSLPATRAQKNMQPTGSATTEKRRQSLIINGTPAKEGEFPWQVALLRKEAPNAIPFEGFFCGGSLISEKWILSAAHCTFEDNPQGPTFPPVAMGPGAIHVYVGSHNFSNGERIPVKAIHRFNYNSETQENDIALLELSKTVKTQNKKFIKFVAHDDVGSTTTGQYVTAIGWGSTQQGILPLDQRSASKVLQHVRIQIKDSQACNRNYVSSYRDSTREYLLAQGKSRTEVAQLVDSWYPLTTQVIGAAMMCAGPAAGSSGDSCFGDSGGPLIVVSGGEIAQAGVVSWGPSEGCGLANLYGVYTRTSAYLNWIEKTASVKPSPER